MRDPSRRPYGHGLDAMMGCVDQSWDERQKHSIEERSERVVAKQRFEMSKYYY